MDAYENQTALPLRSHTILGACEAIGEDFGFNPILLRVPLAACVLWSPIWAIAAYFALSLMVLASRLLFPKADVIQSVQPQPVAAQPKAEYEELEFAKAA